MQHQQVGLLALQSGELLPVEVMQSGAGFYLGTSQEQAPFSRESEEYWPTLKQAEAALNGNDWTQRLFS